MDITSYLRRIKYEGSRVPSLENLKNLQRLHLLSVPFENLDIHLGRKIELKNSFDKIVTKERGGFCYELNGLFYSLLKELGYSVDIISGRVYNKEKKTFPPEYDHMALVIHLGNKNYLVDVGNGEFAFHPLTIELNTLQTDPRGQFVIEESDGDYLLVSKMSNDGKQPQYLFTLKSRAVEEFLPMLDYQQTSPESHFVQKRLCSLPIENGRITLSGNSIKFTTGEIIRDEPLESEEAFQKALLNYFGIRL